jgi:hypothetical protein
MNYSCTFIYFSFVLSCSKMQFCSYFWQDGNRSISHIIKQAKYYFEDHSKKTISRKFYLVINFIRFWNIFLCNIFTQFEFRNAVKCFIIKHMFYWVIIWFTSYLLTFISHWYFSLLVKSFVIIRKARVSTYLVFISHKITKKIPIKSTWSMAFL